MKDLGRLKKWAAVAQNLFESVMWEGVADFPLNLLLLLRDFVQVVHAWLMDEDSVKDVVVARLIGESVTLVRVKSD